MRPAWKSVVSLSFVALILTILLAGCGPTNGLPALTGEYLYVANTDGTISEFSINTTSGLLTRVTSYPAVNTGGLRDYFNLAVHPTNEFIYVADFFNGDLLGFDIGDGDFSGNIFTENSEVSLTVPTVTVITPNGANLYSLSIPATGESVDEYSINLVPGTPSLPNEQNGALTSIGNVNLESFAGGLAVDASGRDAFVTEGQNVLKYLIQTDGTLAANGAFSVTSDASSFLGRIVTTRPTSSTECAYAFDEDFQHVWEMSIDTTNGSLSLVGSVEVNAVTGIGPGATSIVTVPEIRTDPNQQFIYVTSSGAGTIYGLTLASTISKEGKLSCALAPVETQLTVDSNGFVDIAVEPMGKFAYATDFQQLPASVPGTVVELSINQTTGALTPIGTVDAENPPSLTSGPYFPITTH
jgi:hypothetical protein